MRARLVLVVPLLALGCAEKAAAPATAAPSEPPATAEPSPPASPSPADAASPEPANETDEPEPPTDAPTTEPEPARAPRTQATKTREPSALERSVRNQVLAKLKNPGTFDEAAFKKRLESATGAKVVRIRKGPLGLLQITFAPASPPRDKAAHESLASTVAKLDELKFAEPERVLEAKTKP